MSSSNGPWSDPWSPQAKALVMFRAGKPRDAILRMLHAVFGLSADEAYDLADEAETSYRISLDTQTSAC